MRRVLPLLVVLLTSSSAFAWSRAGHMVVGAVAYDELKADHPKTLAKLLNILHGHPQWKTLSNRLDSVDPADRDRYLVMIASRWPDDIRDNKELSHPAWHYIDYPIEAVGDHTPTEPPAPENALTALTSQATILKNPSAPPGDRAIAACWVEHIVGDLHQPLHAVSLYSAKLPKGDRGGNDEWVQMDAESQTINLHMMWDGIVTNTETYKDAANIATELRNRPEFSRQKLAEAKNLDPNEWVKESVDVAFKVAYINGTLQGGTKSQGARLPAGYGKTAKAAGERRMILAGYRLADAMVAALGE